jgi:hypothetical protein
MVTSWLKDFLYPRNRRRFSYSVRILPFIELRPTGMSSVWPFASRRVGNLEWIILDRFSSAILSSRVKASVYTVSAADIPFNRLLGFSGKNLLRLN